MAQKLEETAVEVSLSNKNGKSPQSNLEKYLAVHHVPIAQTVEELYGPKTGQTQKEIRAEVDDFLQMLEEDRKLSRERNLDL